jgi:isopenicillin-N N-acyltransferase-like protein
VSADLSKASSRPPLIKLCGDEYTRGVQLGEQCGASIDQLLRLDEQLVHKQKLTSPTLINKLGDYCAQVEQYMPDVLAHLSGIAQGSGLPMSDIIALQYRRELTAPSDDCSLFGRHENQAKFIAQTIDLQQFVSPFGCVVHESDAQGQAQTLMYTLTGLAGYLGINRHGLAIGINMVRSQDWKVGVSPYLLVRHLLSLDSVEACLAELKRINRASSRTLVIMDSDQLTTVEMTANDIRHWRSKNIVHTNHYIHDEFKCVDQHIRTPSTEERLARLSTLAGVNRGPVCEAQILDYLSDHVGELGAICCHGTTDISAETIGAVLLQPGQRKLSAIKGNPCHSNHFYGFEL